MNFVAQEMVTSSEIQKCFDRGYKTNGHDVATTCTPERRVMKVTWKERCKAFTEYSKHGIQRIMSHQRALYF